MVLKPWDRLDKESSRAFNGFVCYRDMGEERTLQKVSEEVGATFGVVQNWSAKYNWRDRVKAWERFVDRKVQQAQVDEITKMKRRHTALGIRLQQRAMEGLEVLDGASLHPGDLARFASVGVEMERTGRGDTDVMPVLGLHASSPEEVPALLKALRESVETHIEVGEYELE